MTTGRFSRRRLLVVASALPLAACAAPRTSPTAPGPETTVPASDATPVPGATPAVGTTPGALTNQSTPAAPTATPEPKPGPVKLTLADKSWTIDLTEVPIRSSDAGSRIEALLAPIAKEIEKPVVNTRLRILDEGGAELTPASNGQALDVAANRDRILAAATQGRGDVELIVKPVEPTVRDAQAADAKRQLDRIFSVKDEPVLTVKGGDRSWTLDKTETAELLALDLPKNPGDPYKLMLDEWVSKAFVGRLAKALDRPATEPRFAWNGGKMKPLREGQSGRVLDQDAALERFLKTFVAGERTMDLPLKVVAPSVSDDDPAALGIKELIESGSTPFGGAIPEKRWNIKLAAERLNGVVVPPGGTFSFNREVGPTTVESGYRWGFGITSGADGIKTVPSVAGGICQVATTLFQPVFWAGYALEERYWHLYWIPSYASRGIVGLDVTVDDESKLDFKWVNPTKDYVLVQSVADDEKITFQLYGKKPGWTVHVDPAKITNRVPADTTPVIEEEPSLPLGRTIAVEAAREGFDVEVVRKVTTADGAAPRVLTLKSSYQPSRTVTMVGTGGRPAGTPQVGPRPTTTAENRPVAASAGAPDAPPTPTPAPGTRPPGTPGPGTPAAAPAAGTPAAPPAAPGTPQSGATAQPAAPPAPPAAQPPAPTTALPSQAAPPTPTPAPPAPPAAPPTATPNRPIAPGKGNPNKPGG